MRNEDLLRRQVPKSAHDPSGHMRIFLFRQLCKAKVSNLQRRGGRHYEINFGQAHGNKCTSWAPVESEATGKNLNRVEPTA